MEAFSIKTPYGRAYQSFSQDMLELRQEVNFGKQLYRAGELGRTNIAEGQFWASKNPLLTPDFSQKYGTASFSKIEFVTGGRIKSGSNFITRRAPSYGSNLGGSAEAVTDDGGIFLDYFYMP